MSSISMELSKSDRINYIRDVVEKTLKKKKTILKSKTYDALRGDIYSNWHSKAKLIKKYNELLGYNKDVTTKSAVKDIKKQIKELNKKVKSVVGKRTTYDRHALGGIFKKHYITDDLDHPIDFIFKRLANLLEAEYDANKKSYNLIAYLFFKYDVYKSADGGKIIEKHNFHSDTLFITSKNIIKGYMEDTKQKFYNYLETCKQASDSIFKGFTEIHISTSRNKAIAGKSFIELPLWIKNKKACVNIKNDDDKCFKWALVASQSYDLIKSTSKSLVSYYKKYESMIKEPENCSYPVKLNDIESWELANDMKINIIKIIDGQQNFWTAHTTLNYNPKVVNLLLIDDGNDNSHYVWVKSINALYASKTSHKVKYMCSQCHCKSFSSQEKLDEHIQLKLCQAFNAEQQPCKCIMPTEGKNIMKFINEGNSFKHPFHVIADFESTLEKVEDDKNKSTQKYQHHVQNSYGIKYNCIHDEHSEPIKIFNSPDCEKVSENFILDLERLAKKSYDLLQLNKNNIIFESEEHRIELYQQAKTCAKCYSPFDRKTYKKVRHHDHISGEFLGAYCNECNLKYKYKRFLPVYLHNLKGYDSHLFVKALYQYGYQENKQGDTIECIPNNEERYISFSKTIKVGEYTIVDKDTGEEEIKDATFEIRFLDTLSFMATSIDKLSENLSKDCKTIEDKRKAFKNVSEQFPDDVEFELMIKKGIYPYDYIDKYNRLYETKLPRQEAFYSQLYNSECSNDDYERAKLVWRTFDCKTMMDYHNLYLVTDVLLLADIWENFREVCYTKYKLDCEYYYTAPSLSFDAMLKLTGVQLELLTNLKMFEFVESGIRGGISQISHRHAIANNKYLQNYDESKEDSYIVYLDANNLYGTAMCEYLPYKDFQWNTDEWTKEKILAVKDDADKGYLFSVDLHIPSNLHDYMNNYPPCPENISINKSDLNGWQQEGYKNSKIKKLCCTFYDKINYVVNYRYLKLVLSLGVELIQVNKVLEYSQKPFMKEYIMLNNRLRKKSKNDFEKDFFKLMNNSVFGKTMENVRNRINFRLINTEKEALAVKNMKRFTIFNDDLVGVHIKKTEVTLCKPIYIGQNILDDSKVTMYDFHYNFMLKKVDRKNIDLLFTDTDSLCYNIRNKDIFEVIKENKDLFDLSNYPKDHELYDDVNNKALGKFKNESPTQITEFIGLRAKLYSYTVDGEDQSHNKAKGTKQCVVKRDITINDYRDSLYNRTKKIVSQNGIRSYGHDLYTERISKVALSGNDDKVHILDNNVNTRNLGHYKNKIDKILIEKRLFYLNRE